MASFWRLPLHKTTTLITRKKKQRCDPCQNKHTAKTASYVILYVNIYIYIFYGTIHKYILCIINDNMYITSIRAFHYIWVLFHYFWVLQGFGLSWDQTETSQNQAMHRPLFSSKPAIHHPAKMNTNNTNVNDVQISASAIIRKQVTACKSSKQEALFYHFFPLCQSIPLHHFGCIPHDVPLKSNSCQS